MYIEFVFEIQCGIFYSPVVEKLLLNGSCNVGRQTAKQILVRFDVVVIVCRIHIEIILRDTQLKRRLPNISSSSSLFARLKKKKQN